MKCDELKTVCYIDAYSTMPVYCAKEVDEAFDELKQVIKYKEGVGKSWFDRCMEARTLWVKNTRALWLARALALSRFDVDKYIYNHMKSKYWNDGDEIFNLACKSMQNKINEAKEILLKKAEEYK